MAVVVGAVVVLVASVTRNRHAGYARARSKQGQAGPNGRNSLYGNEPGAANEFIALMIPNPTSHGIRQSFVSRPERKRPCVDFGPLTFNVRSCYRRVSRFDRRCLR